MKELSQEVIFLDPIMSKVFFITGAGSGLGRVTARYLLLKGHRVFLTDYNESFLEMTCTKHLTSVIPTESTSNYKWSRMDVSNGEDVAQAVQKCVKEFGTIDVLINSKVLSSVRISSMLTRNHIQTQELM